MKKYIYLFLLAFLFVGCKKDKEEHEHNEIFTITVASEKGSLPQMEMPDLYWVKYDNEEKWSTFPDHIRNFNYEKGFEYVIKVQSKHKEGLIPMDASCCNYTLLEIISKVKKESEGLKKN